MTKKKAARGHDVRRRATGVSLAIQATVGEQAAAARPVQRVAHDEHDARELLDALGLADGDVA